MWQIVLGVYLVVVVLSTLLLWSALVLAKRSDQNIKSRLHRTRLTYRDEGDLIKNQVLKLPTLSQLIKK